MNCGSTLIHVLVKADDVLGLTYPLSLSCNFIKVGSMKIKLSSL